MRPEDLRELIRRQPFMPFRIHTTDSQTYDIRHPDQVIVLRSRLVIGITSNDEIPDRVEHLALIHIVRLEELVIENKVG